MENTEKVLYTISEIIECYISGDWGNDCASEDAQCAVSCIRGADIVPILNSEFSEIPLRYISSKSFSTRALQEGDIVIEKSGGSPTQSTGRVVYVSKELLSEKEQLVCSNFCAAFRIKPEWDSKYVFFYLQHIYNAGVFFNFEGKTSGLKNLIMDTAFQSITIKKIAIEEQRSIAKILSTIDSKAAANRAINKNLEAMAKLLYDYWFVQFDFPDENGRPYKSSGGKMVWNEKLKREIPEGWEQMTMGDVCAFRNGINYSLDEVGTKYNIVNVRNISASTFLLDGEDFDEVAILPSKAINYLLAPNDIIIARSGCPGSTRLLWRPNNTIFCGFIICCTPIDKDAKLFLSFYLKQLEGTNATVSGGSILLNVSQETLKRLAVALPPTQVLYKFNEAIVPFFNLSFASDFTTL